MLEVGRWFYCLGGILFLFFSSSCSAISRRDLSVTTILKVFRFLFFHFRNWFNKFFLSSISWKHRKLWDYRLLLSLPPEELDHLKSCRNSNRIVERTHRMLWAAPLPKSVQVSKSQPSPSPLPPSPLGGSPAPATPAPRPQWTWWTCWSCWLPGRAAAGWGWSWWWDLQIFRFQLGSILLKYWDKLWLMRTGYLEEEIEDTALQQRAVLWVSVSGPWLTKIPKWSEVSWLE